MPYLFSIDVTTARSQYLLAAASAEELTSWLETLNGALKQLPGRSTIRYDDPPPEVKESQAMEAKKDAHSHSPPPASAEPVAVKPPAPDVSLIPHDKIIASKNLEQLQVCSFSFFVCLGQFSLGCAQTPGWLELGWVWVTLGWLGWLRVAWSTPSSPGLSLSSPIRTPTQVSLGWG